MQAEQSMYMCIRNLSGKNNINECYFYKYREIINSRQASALKLSQAVLIAYQSIDGIYAIAKPAGINNFSICHIKNVFKG